MSYLSYNLNQKLSAANAAKPRQSVFPRGGVPRAIQSDAGLSKPLRPQSPMGGLGLSSSSKLMPWLYASVAPFSSSFRREVDNPSVWVRKGFNEVETSLVSRTLQEGKSAFLNSASHLGGMEGRLAVGAATEIEHGLAVGVCRAEPFVYRALTKMGRFLAGFSWREVLRNTDSFIQQLFMNRPPDVLKKSTSLNQYVRRIFIATAIGFAGVKLMLKIYEWATPYLAKKLGHRLDRLLGTPKTTEAAPICWKPTRQHSVYRAAMSK